MKYSAYRPHLFLSVLVIFCLFSFRDDRGLSGYFFNKLHPQKVQSGDILKWKQFGPAVPGYCEMMQYHPADPGCAMMTTDMCCSYRNWNKGHTWPATRDCDGNRGDLFWVRCYGFPVKNPESGKSGAQGIHGEFVPYEGIIEGYKQYRLEWQHGVLYQQNMGGMIGPVVFNMPDGNTFSPLYLAPWSEEEVLDLPPITHMIRGEWPCVPFGKARRIKDLADGWPDPMKRYVEEPPHGYGSNGFWDMQPGKDGTINMSITYPDDHPVASLGRTVKPLKELRAIEFTLQVNARRDTCFPAGVHPIFRLPDKPGGVVLKPGSFTFGMTFPGDFEPGAYLLEPGTKFASLSAVHGRDGSKIDLSRLPLEQKSENLVMLCGIEGKFELEYIDEGYRVTLEWDPEDFPSCVLWMSNYGRDYEPWNSRNLCLGIEPVASCFDLGPYASAADNPVNREGIPTCLEFRHDQQWQTRYRISVQQLQQ